MIKMGFVIGVLHRDIEQLHLEQFGGRHPDTAFTVYRGQGLSKDAFEQMHRTEGGLIFFNTFLSTSKVRDVSLNFARRAGTNPDLVGVIFVMTIDPSNSTTSFVSIIDVSYFKGEDEVLFSMHTVFRIRNIKPTDGNHRLFQVDLTLTNDNDPDLHTLTDRIREETFSDFEGWRRLITVLLKMGESEKTRQVSETILEQKTDESGKAAPYIQLGVAKHNQGEYKKAIEFYEKAVQIYQNTLPPNYPDLAHPYSNIGSAHYSVEDYSKALSYYEKAPAIRQQSLPPNHPELAASHYNMGLLYEEKGDYSKARSSFERALDIIQRSLPSNHPKLQDCRNNLDRIKKKL